MTEYAPGASGDAAPIATIQGPQTGLNAPDNATIDSTGHIWVANYGTDGSVTEYATDASGDAKPIRTIEGPDTQLFYPSDVVLDAAGHIFVSNDMSIVEYGPDASGNAKPIASIHGPHTGLNGAAGLTIGRDGQIYAANFGYYPGYVWPGPSYGSVTVYRRGANGDASPIREIKGDYPSNDRTGLSGGPCGEPALDSEGNVYVATVTSNTVRVFGPDATGNVAPIRTIAGPSTGIGSPVGVFLG